MLSNKAEVDAVDENGQTPLHYACNVRALEVICLLLENKADVNTADKKQRTPLHLAVNQSVSSTDASFDVEELLLQHKAQVRTHYHLHPQVNAKDYLSRTCLHYCFIKIGNFQDSR